MTDTIEAAKRLHDRYDRAQIARHRLMVPRQWNALPQDCRQEFIDIAEAVIRGDCTYNGHEVPRWVIDTVNRPNILPLRQPVPVVLPPHPQ